MTFKNKDELIQFVKEQTNILLPKDKDDRINNKRNILYTEIRLSDKIMVLSLLNKHGIGYEQHIGNNYFIYIKN
jgi:hypothetical protein